MKTKSSLIYADECYQIMGVIFQIYNELGFGHKESVYQKAIAYGFKNKGIDFKEQLRFKLKYKEEDVGLYILDFLVFDKIALEIKQKNFISGKDIKQLYRYLKAMNLRLGVIVTFTHEQVRYKRIVNL
jgi:GxxExxY protein